MIIRKRVTINSKDYIISFSDGDFFILGGNPKSKYISAIDPVDLDRQYVESKEKIPKERQIKRERKERE